MHPTATKLGWLFFFIVMAIIFSILLGSPRPRAEPATPTQALQERITDLIAGEIGRCRIENVQNAAKVEALQKALSDAISRADDLDRRLQELSREMNRK